MEKGRRWERVFRTACDKWLHGDRPPALPAGEGSERGGLPDPQRRHPGNTGHLLKALEAAREGAGGKAGFISLWKGNKSRALGALGVSPGLPQDGLSVQLGCPLPAWLPE